MRIDMCERRVGLPNTRPVEHCSADLGLPSDPSVEKIKAGGANTHIVFHAGKLMALQEGSNPFEMDRIDLASKDWVETGGRFTAHPKIDPHSGEMLWFGYSTGDTPLNAFMDYGITDACGRVLRRDQFKAPYCSMVHDFIVTEKHTVFPVLPLTGDMERAKRGLPAFAWEPQKGAFVGLMARSASVDSIRWIEVDPVYVFHPVNAYETNGKLHCEMMEYPQAPLFPNPDGSRGVAANARIVRWTIDLGDRNARVVRTPLDDLVGEFPRIDERFAGLPYRHCWHAANVEMNEPLLFDALAHVDFKTNRTTLRRFSAGDTVGEPVFVPRSADAPEGDGWILAVVHRAGKNLSELQILNAQDIARRTRGGARGTGPRSRWISWQLGSRRRLTRSRVKDHLTRIHSLHLFRRVVCLTLVRRQINSRADAHE